jgi:K+-sensing histidine kinase KdpD
MNKSGIGLGLYICKKIIEQCQGVIYYDKTYEKGAAFVFTVKCQDERAFEDVEEV